MKASDDGTSGWKPARPWDLFAELSEEELRELHESSRQVTLSKGSPLFLGHERKSSIYQLKSGRIKMVRLSPDGRECILDIVEEGQIFGEMSLFGEGPQDAMGVALEESRILVMPGAKLEKLLRRNPELILTMARLMSLRRRAAEERLENFFFTGTPGRLAALLLQLSNAYGVPDHRGTLLRIELSQAEMGNLIGVSREHVNHTLSDFRRRGLIGREGRQLILHEKRRFQQIASAPGR